MSTDANTHRDDVIEENQNSQASVPMILQTSLATDIALSTLNDIQRGMAQDAPITTSDLRTLKFGIGQSRVNVEGRTSTLDDEELKRNGKIWREILDENTTNYRDLSILPPPIARKLTSLESSIQLPRVTTISDESILVLTSGQKTLALELDGLRSITEKQFCLLRMGRRSLQMNGLTSMPHIDESMLFRLSEDRKSLQLNGLRSLSSNELQTLLTIAGDLGLDGLESLPELSEDVQRALRMHSSHVSLNGLDSISDEQFRQLLSKKTNTIRLHGIRKLPPLSKETEQALSERVWGSLSLGLETVSDAEFRALLGSKKTGISLNALKTLPEFSEETVRKIAVHTGYIYLDGLTSITDRQFLQLLKQQAALSLGVDSLPHLSDETINALSRHFFPISLRVLTSVSERQAYALKQHGSQTYVSSTVQEDMDAQVYDYSLDEQ